MIRRWLMSWFHTRRAAVTPADLGTMVDAHTAQTDRLESKAAQIEKRAENEQRQLLRTVEDTHRRRAAREQRIRDRAQRDPNILAVNAVIRILEGHP